MSILIYAEELKKLFAARVKGKSLEKLGEWAAHNRTAEKSKGPWPNGVFHWWYFKEHPEEGYMPASLVDTYGGTGIHVFKVPERPGIGVHAGRSQNPNIPGWNTLGCIRTTSEAMVFINKMHESDGITHISVVKHSWHEAHTSGKGALDWGTKS
jgi:hypothetical protein